ncbi:hypothetical protein ACEN9F_10860 [Duganella sp. CT11-25]|jgi:hypothetical protein|uniref:hypothetical protein n=1 Tax=unclassified Duganella TaxID=2636909 RepID=UPI0039AF582D
MTAKRIALALALLCCAQSALADELRIPVPGEGWTLKLDAPSMSEVPAAREGHVYTGNAGKLNLSLHVSKPLCPGGDSNENLYKCFGAKMQGIPHIINGSIRASETANGIQVTYLMEVSSGDKKVRAFNLNYLFVKNGKWADVHVSVVQPVKEDLESVFKLIDTIGITDEKPAS